MSWGCFGGTGWAAPCLVTAEEKNDEVVYPYPGAAWFFPLAVEGTKTMNIDLK